MPGDVGPRPKALVRLGDGNALRTVNMVIYGHPGVGKTPFWGTAGEKGFIMDSDHGVESAEAFGSKSSTMEVNDFQQLEEVADFFRYGKGCQEFDWIVWDSGTLFMDRALVDDILADAHAANPKQSEDVASQREYLILQNRFAKWVRVFAALPINFGLSAHVMVTEDPEGKLVYMPNFPGKRGTYSSKICGYMNVIGYMGLTPGGTRRILFEQSQSYYARDRFDAIKSPKGNAFMDNPTIPKIMRLIDAKRKG